MKTSIHIHVWDRSTVTVEMGDTSITQHLDKPAAADDRDIVAGICANLADIFSQGGNPVADLAALPIPIS